jgi:hypothetical protein
MVVEFPLTLSLSRWERGRKLKVFALCQRVCLMNEYGGLPPLLKDGAGHDTKK